MGNEWMVRYVHTATMLLDIRLMLSLMMIQVINENLEKWTSFEVIQ